MTTRRILSNLFGEWFRMGRAFPPEVLDAITASVSQGEATHRGELRVAIESRLPLAAVAQGVTARDRAAMLFAHLRVWDTEENCGVLLYVLLSEHRIEIVADRGIASRVSADEWATITDHMRDAFANERFHEGVLTGVTEAGALLATHYPGDGTARENQLPDRPLLL
ncbi:MAG: hypothetical protein GAK28_02372 [Luteibacter sp.]|uniref:TPM domain-containing protein n=1 Tax=Luteibacter sp. TaxID=1886636 RepID=UPI001382F2B6|nr:TPM domain-containing protein [Luteibacter sp.]KAF1006698.1 MAG: hypothetical protein GAK28_02372 [Luteibacter sp.]